MNTQDAETIATSSDERLLAMLANPGDLQPETIAEARAQLRKRGVLVGVGGWLKFLCIWLAILVPVGVTLQIAGLCIGFFQDHGYYPRTGYGGLVLPLLLRLFIASFAIKAGSGLWARRPDAVKVAQRFFVWVIIVAFVGPFISFSAWNDVLLGRPTADSLLVPLMISVLSSAFWVALWSAYLGRSVRVRNTYIPGMPLRPGSPS